MAQLNFYAEGIQGSPLGFVARVKGASEYITQDTLSSITCKVFDLQGATPSTPVATPTVTISTSVYDTLQTNTLIWSKTPGYNFVFNMPIATFPKMTKKRRYRVVFIFTPVEGETIILNYQQVEMWPADIEGL